MTVTCFWLEAADLMTVALRRFCWSSKGEHSLCPGSPIGIHEAKVTLGTAGISWSDTRPEGVSIYFLGKDDRLAVADYQWPDHDDPRWPLTCSHCGRLFADDDNWQHFVDRVYTRTDNGQQMTLRDAPDGAMWDAYWMKHRAGADGLCVQVRCPGGKDWIIDSRASNCALPDDDTHRCWIRHGTPPALTVDKNGPTCAAGGGSIVAGGYHGFLVAGSFT